MMDMQPKPGDYSIQIPITFDYKGGRGENNRKNLIIISILFLVLMIATCVAIFMIQGIEVWQKFLYSFIGLLIWTTILRYVGFNEIYYSDIYELLLSRDFALYTEDMWQIFDIDYKYPYVCYFKNGTKGIFVSMERDAITGKPATAMYDHYEIVANAYNLAHSLNMNIVHIDYMDNVGNDVRLQKMMADTGDIKNPDMQNLIRDIYYNLESEMTNNYASHDIYLYLTREDKSNFFYNVQSVANTMLGGNFITYTIMDRDEISVMVKELFNLHDFSILKACTNLITGDTVSGIRAIAVKHGDGTVEVFNKTTREQELEYEQRLRQEHEDYLDKKAKRRAARKTKKNKGGNNDSQDDFDSLDLF